MLSFFPRDVLDEIWDLIESVSEGFPTYSWSDADVTLKITSVGPVLGDVIGLFMHYFAIIESGLGDYFEIKE